MSTAQRLAMQRLARSQDRQEQRQVSQTSSSSYGAWFTPDVDKPIRRPLTSPSKQIAAQQEQLRRCRLSGGSSGSSTPDAPAAASVSAHGGLPDPVSTQQAGPAAARPQGAMAQGAMAQGAMAQGAMAKVGAPVVEETRGAAYAVCTKEGCLHVNHDRGAVAVLPDEGVALFAMLDGHGQVRSLSEACSVSITPVRVLFAVLWLGLANANPNPNPNLT